MKRVLLFLTGFLIFGAMSYAQVGINVDNAAPNPSAGLDIQFTNKGLLPPRMSKAQRDLIADPAEGLIVICNDCILETDPAVAVYLNGSWRVLFCNCTEPSSPVARVPSASDHTIIWKWNSVSAVSGYRWSADNIFAAATELNTDTSKVEPGLNCSTTYTRYIWAYNDCGFSNPTILTFTTTPCFSCGVPFTVSHTTTGGVAPVAKTVSYGTATNIPGEPAKCWLTRNLGASQQAIVVNDATEASAGWYWRFNQKQGYRAAGGNSITPQWITGAFSENSNWIMANDPCYLELGLQWRIPTISEWENLVSAGGWTDWTGPFNSALKIHAAGYINPSAIGLIMRGNLGSYWSNAQRNSSYSYNLQLIESSVLFPSNEKRFGYSVRCVRD